MGKKRVVVVAIMRWCGNLYQTVMYQYLGVYNPLSLCLNKNDASSFGDVKQICFAETFYRERISPLMRCKGIFPFLFSQFSPNISFILPILCWPVLCSHSPWTLKELKKAFTSYPMTTKMLHTLQSAKCFLKNSKNNIYYKKLKKKG